MNIKGISVHYLFEISLVFFFFFWFIFIFTFLNCSFVFGICSFFSTSRTAILEHKIYRDKMTESFFFHFRLCWENFFCNRVPDSMYSKSSAQHSTFDNFSFLTKPVLYVALWAVVCFNKTLSFFSRSFYNSRQWNRYKCVVWKI